MSKRLTTKRIEALIAAAVRGHDEMECDGDLTPRELSTILAGVHALHALHNKRTANVTQTTQGDKQ